MVDILGYTCPNRMRVGAIDSPDRFEHVFEPGCIQKVLEKSFTDDILEVRPQTKAKNDFLALYKEVRFIKALYKAKKSFLAFI